MFLNMETDIDRSGSLNSLEPESLKKKSWHERAGEYACLQKKWTQNFLALPAVLTKLAA